MSQKSMAGQYKRQNITLPPGQVEYIKDLADGEDMSGLSFYRWLIDVALQAYEDGVRPEVTERIVRGEARMAHWSSELNES